MTLTPVFELFIVPSGRLCVPLPLPGMKRVLAECNPEDLLPQRKKSSRNSGRNLSAFSASWLKVPQSHVRRLSLEWGRTGERGAAFDRSGGWEAPDCLVTWRRLEQSVWTMCAAALEEYCGSIFWVSSKAWVNVALGTHLGFGEMASLWPPVYLSVHAKD